MKSLKIFAGALMLSVSLPSMAQFANNSASASADNENYHRVSVGYNATFLSPKHSDGSTLNGFAAQYTYGLSLSQEHPMFLEFGAGLSYGASSKDKKKGIDSFKMFSFFVPVNYVWKFNINDKFTIAPYAGLNFKVHASAKCGKHNLFEYSDADKAQMEELSNEIDNNYENWLDSEDDKDLEMIEQLKAKRKEIEDSKWKRFQMGWQIGVGAYYDKWFAGIQFGTDFIKVQKNMNSSNLGINIGYTF